MFQWDIAENFNFKGTDCSCCHKLLAGTDPIFFSFEGAHEGAIPPIHFCGVLCARVYNLIKAIKYNIEPGDTGGRKNQPVVQLSFIVEELEACADIVDGRISQNL